MRIQFGGNAYHHGEDKYGLPPIRLENWMAEEAPERPDSGFRLVPTPGTVAFSSPTAGTGRGMFRSDGVISGDIIAVLGANVFKINSAGTATQITGSITDDSLPVNMASSQTPELVAAGGGSTYTIDGSNVTSFSWTGPTGNIVDVAEINQRHLYLEEDSGRIWYSNVADATTVGTTDFVTAESEPDQLIGLETIGDTIMLLGTQTLELWRETGDVTTVLLPRPGGTIPIGLIARNAKTTSDFGFFMVGTDSIVYRFNGFQPSRISTHPIERAISGLSDANRAKVRLSSYSDEGHAFVHLHLPGEADYFYDSNTRAWHRRKALGEATVGYGYDYYVRAFGNVYAQNETTGALVELSTDAFDDVGTAYRRVATALVPVSGPRRITNLVVDGQSGMAPDGAGQGSDPIGMLTVAHNGRTFGNEIERSLGKKGEFDTRVVYGPLGMAKPPLILFEFAVSDPLAYVINGADVNMERP